MSGVRPDIDAWLAGERAYATTKWPDEGPVLNGDTALPFDEWVHQYLHRARVLKIHTTGGRQALAKALMTLMRYVEHVIDEHGPLPPPGLPSGHFRP